MVLKDFAVMTNRLSEEVSDKTPRHFDHRALRLERGLYVIRERANGNFSDSSMRKNDYPSKICGD